MKNATKTTKKTTPAAAPKATKKTAAAKPEAPATLDIHINVTGRVCFGRHAAARIGDLAHMLVKVDGKTLRLIARKDATDESVDIRRAGKRPYISATKALKELGWEGKKALDLVADPINSHGFACKVA
jgi:hypothetical protein